MAEELHVIAFVTVTFTRASETIHSKETTNEKLAELIVLHLLRKLFSPLLIIISE